MFTTRVTAVQGHWQFISLPPKADLVYFDASVSAIHLRIQLKIKLDFAQTVWLCLKTNQSRIISCL